MAKKNLDIYDGFLYTHKVAVTGDSKVTKLGRIAQLGEHLPYKQGVIGSSPIVPTKLQMCSAEVKLSTKFTA